MSVLTKLQKICEPEFLYGVRSKVLINGDRYHFVFGADDKIDWKLAVIQSPEQLLQLDIGCCHDISIYLVTEMKKQFKEEQIKFIHLNLNNACHSFVILQQDSYCLLIDISNIRLRGIWKCKNLEQAIAFEMMSMIMFTSHGINSDTNMNNKNYDFIVSYVPIDNLDLFYGMNIIEFDRIISHQEKNSFKVKWNIKNVKLPVYIWSKKNRIYA